MNKKKINIDEFFEEHFKNLGEPKRSAEREEKMLSEIITYAREKGLVRKKQVSFTQRVKDYFSNFNIFSLRYAIPSLAAMLVILIIIFSIYNSDDDKTELNTKSNISKINSDLSDNTEMSSQSETQSETQIENNNDFNDAESSDYPSSKEIEKPGKTEFYSDLAILNYDFSTRSLSEYQNENEDNVVGLIAKYFEKRNIDINYDGRKIKTEWFIRNGIETQVNFEILKLKKDINVRVVQKSETLHKSNINQYLDTIKNDIQDLIMENVFSKMAK